jgi:hypothetical protein
MFEDGMSTRCTSLAPKASFVNGNGASAQDSLSHSVISHSGYILRICSKVDMVDTSDWTGIFWIHVYLLKVVI